MGSKVVGQGMSLAASPVKTPDNIHGYRVLKHIGSGAASEIYCVFETKSGSVYALKQVLFNDGKDKDDRFLVQAENEVKVSKKLDHPAIRRIHSVTKIRPKGWARTEVIVLMELVDGTPLEKLLIGTPVLEKVRIFRIVAEALAHMNDQGFVHADMKPTNVLVTDKGEVKVIDLGQAHPIGKAKERIQGTPGFMAPEQAKVEPLNERTDVYNFGATMYWMLTGNEVSTAGFGSGRGHAEVPTPANALNRDVPPSLGDMVNICLEPNQHGRWKNMHAVVRQLDKVIAELEADRGAA
jgi:serine/threonine protein kinase